MGTGQQPTPALTARQERIAGRLRGQVGEGPAELFTAACELLAQEPVPRAVTHLVAHLYREVEGAVRFVLDPEKDKRGHRPSVEAVLDELGISRDEQSAEFWLELASADKGLAMRAHRNGLERPRPVDAEFTGLADRFEDLLDRVLKRFEDRYASVFDRLDELMKIQQPGSGHAQVLRNGFPQNQAVLGYFFERAAPAWLVPLRGQGFFSSPPEPVPHGDEGAFELPFWPQSRYLLRIARDVPAEVASTALGIPATENGLVNANMVDLALEFPADQSARFVPRVLAALGGRFGILAPDRAGRLCSHLAEGGRPADALLLAEALLARLHEPGRSCAVIDTWSFAEVLRRDFPVIARACGLPALSMLARLLDHELTAQAPAGSAEMHLDTSTWWRPEIGGQPQGTDTDPASALVSAIRDTAAALLSASQASLGEMIAELEPHSRLVFRRLALYLLAEHATAGDSGLVGAHLADAAAIRDHGRDREFLALAGRHCTTVSPRDLERLLALIDQGPETSQWARRHEELNGVPPSAALTRDRASRWQRDRLAVIEPALSPEWRARYGKMTAEFGHALGPAPALPPVRATLVGTPVPVDALAAASAGDLARLLASWEPTGGPLGPGRYSLASALTPAVRQDAASRSSQAGAFIGLPGVYVEAVISAFWQAAVENTELDWPPVLKLCSWADEQAEAELREPRDQPHREWHAARMATLQLLEAGFAPSGSEIPEELAGQAWAIIQNAAVDPDPEAGAEASASGMPLGEFARAHVRPRALTTAVAYAAWARRRNPATGLGAVQQLIENQLGPGLPGSSLPVRWACGASFGAFAQLFRPWAAEKAPRIFPLQEDLRHLWTAAWDGYLTRRLDFETCEVLGGSYQLAVDLTDPASDDRAELARANNLGMHLLTRYWHGRMTFDSHGRLLRRYYRNAPVSVRVSLMHFMERSLSAEGPVPAELLTGLWEERLQAVRDGADPAELAPFGGWFTAARLGEEWELRQLLTVLNTAGKIEFGHQVLPRLAVLAPEHAIACLAVLEAWVRTNPALYWLQGQDESVRVILQAGNVSGSPAAAESVQTIISLCTAKGHDLRKFRDG